MYRYAAFAYLYCNKTLSKSMERTLLTLATQDFLLIDVAGIVKSECCTCSQGQVLQKELLGQCCRLFSELNFLLHVADIGDTWLHVQPPLTSSCQCE